MARFVQLCVASALTLCIAGGCSGKRPGDIGMGPSGLKGCPKSPNCVSSAAEDRRHAVEPFRTKGDPGTGWTLVRKEIESTPGWTIVTATDTYIHAECKSRIFRFVDDLELYLDVSHGTISVRSASRIGYSDFGANRRRVELLRRTLRKKQIIE